MTRWLSIRLLWLVLTLLGVTVVTFLVLDLAPVDRAELEAMQAQAAGAYATAADQREAVLALRVHYGMVDPETREPLPVWQRYGAWLANAAMLRLAGPGDDPDAFWQRFTRALPVSLLLGGLSVLVIVLCGLPMGVWLGRRAGARIERFWSTVLLVVIGLPEFLLATLLLLAFGVLWLQWFPTHGLTTKGAEHWHVAMRLLDFCWHLVLPVTIMSVAPAIMVSRFVRDAVVRASRAPFVTGMHALGIAQRVIDRRLLRHGATPLATLAGGLLPMLVGGSIVVENMFSLEGIGRLAYRSAHEQDQAMIMALVLMTSVVTLAAMLISDLLHRVVDARVRLAG